MSIISVLCCIKTLLQCAMRQSGFMIYQVYQVKTDKYTWVFGMHKIVHKYLHIQLTECAKLFIQNYRPHFSFMWPYMLIGLAWCCYLQCCWMFENLRETKLPFQTVLQIMVKIAIKVYVSTFYFGKEHQFQVEFCSSRYAFFPKILGRKCCTLLGMGKEEGCILS